MERVCEWCSKPLGDGPVVRHETGDYHARCSLPEPTYSVEPSDAQRAAIEAQALLYLGPDSPCDGLDAYTAEPASAWDYAPGGRWAGKASYPEGAVAVQYRYRYDDDRKGSGMTGLEVTVFDRDGKVVDSQDFG